MPNKQRQRRTCYAMCHILYPVSAALTSIFRMDSNSTSYPTVLQPLLSFPSLLGSGNPRPQRRSVGGVQMQARLEEGRGAFELHSVVNRCNLFPLRNAGVWGGFRCKHVSKKVAAPLEQRQFVTDGAKAHQNPQSSIFLSFSLSLSHSLYLPLSQIERGTPRRSWRRRTKTASSLPTPRRHNKTPKTQTPNP